MGASPSFAYTVKSGDTMSKIAKSNNLTLSQITSYNPQISNVNKIYVGQNVNTSPTKKTPQTGNISVSASDKDLLARLVQAEASGEPYAGKVAVAAVVLNRVKSPDFPNTVSAVVNQAGQFSPVSNGEIKKAANSDSIKAVNEALTYTYPTATNSLFFYNSKTATSRWLDSRPTTVVIGNHTFKK
ncbi:cell wall hydrolase [Priestia megaterium]